MRVLSPQKDSGPTVLMGKGWTTVRGCLSLPIRGVRLRGPVRLRGRGAKVKGGSRITLGSRVVLGGQMFPVQMVAGRGGRILVGTGTFINQGVGIHAEVEVRIGDNVRIGDLCAIYDTNFHGLDREAAPRVSPVLIEDDVWLGRNVTILPGTRIGAGSVIGASSVVGGIIPAGSLVQAMRPSIRSI